MIHVTRHGAVLFCGQDDIIAALHRGIFLRSRLESLLGGLTGELEQLPLKRHLIVRAADDPAILLLQLDWAIPSHCAMQRIALACFRRALLKTGAPQLV